MTQGVTMCPRCGGGLDYGRTIKWTVTEGNDVVLVEVVADVCTQCGEKLLHPQMVDKIIEAKRLLKAGAPGPAVGRVYELRKTGT